MKITAKIWGDWIHYEISEYGYVTNIMMIHNDTFFSLEDIIDFHDRSRAMVTSDDKVSEN